MRSNLLVGWKSVFAKLADAGVLDISTPTNLSTLEHKNLLGALEEDLKEWQQKQAAGMRASAPVVDPKVATKLIATLHKVFSTRKTEEIEIGALGAYAQMVGELDTELDAIKNLIRAVAKLNPNMFSVGAGGAPRVRRLHTAQGKTTGLEAFDTSRGGGGVSAGSDGLQRFSKRVKALGFATKLQFEKAKKDIGSDAPTAEQLSKWIRAS